MTRWLPLIVIGGILGAVLAGCSGSMSPPGTPEYKEGWRYGCWEGSDDADGGPFFGQLLTPPQYAETPDFKRGWNEAYGECYRRAMMHSLNIAL